jgi:hypothetical protein
MNDDLDSEIDRLLRDAGAAWRAGRVDEMKIGSSRFAALNRPARGRWVTIVVAVSLTVIFAGVVGKLWFGVGTPDTGQGAVLSPSYGPSLPGTPQPSRPLATPPPASSSPTGGPFAVVQNGDRVMAEGFVVDNADTLMRYDADSTVLCPELLDAGVAGVTGPPICKTYTAVRVRGVDLNSLGGEQQDPFVISDYARVVGTWSDDSITVVDAEEVKRPATSLNRSVPCSTPEGGWPGSDASTPSNDSLSRLGDFVNAHPDTYSGAWTGDIIGDGTAVVVGTIGSVASEAERLAKIYPYNLCVIHVNYSATDLEHLAQTLAGQGFWQTYVDATVDRVIITTPVLDALTAQLLIPYSEELDVRTTVTRVP